VSLTCLLVCVRARARRRAASTQYPDFVDYYNRFVVGHRRNFEETYELGQQIGRGAFGNVFRSKKIGGVVQGERPARAFLHSPSLPLPHTSLPIPSHPYASLPFALVVQGAWRSGRTSRSSR
jgi:hypothetical protein